MKKYIFATDVDGTLLNDQGEIHPETIEAFKRAQEQSSYTVIATGRSVLRTKPLLKKIPYVDFFVCNNGSVVYDVKKDEIIYLIGVNPNHYPKILDFAREHHVTFKLHTEADWIGDAENKNEKPTPLTSELDQKIRVFIQENPFSTTLFNGQTPTQLSINGSEEFCKKYFQQFKDWFGQDSSVYLTNSVYLDVNPKDKSKWTGLLELAKILQIDTNHIVTFGDSYNDLDMLLNAKDNGYPLANSKLELLEHIPAKIGSNNTNAIAKKILEYLQKE